VEKVVAVLKYQRGGALKKNNSLLFTIKLSFIVCVIVFWAVLCPSHPGFTATGGWRTQQANKDIPVVETPPIPGVPYGKDANALAEDKPLPPEIKEIDEAIKKDAEVLQRSLYRGTVSSGSQEDKGMAGSGGAGTGVVSQSLGVQGTVGISAEGQKDAGSMPPSLGGQGPAASPTPASTQFSSDDVGKDAGKSDVGKTAGGSAGDKTSNIKKADTAQGKGGGKPSSRINESGPSGVATSQEMGLPHKSQNFLWKAVIILAVITVLVIVGKRYVFGGR
jgi:hypothetical protein